MRPHRRDWLYRCGTCGFLRATLAQRIESTASRAIVDEPRRAKGLNSLRLVNFQRILDRVQSAIAPAGRTLLDVGCAHGWFLDGAAERGFDAVGIEPDPAIGTAAAADGRKVWSGFFPDDIPLGARFDVISFNDVFEHLPDVDQALDACARLLKPGGLLVLNVPCRNGIFYRLATVLERMRIPGPLERLWQIRFASPHFSYFAPQDLQRLAARRGLAEIHASTLPSVQLRGLWARLNYDTTASVAFNTLIWLSVALVCPLFPLLPADISLQIFRKADETQGR